jgi:hypothetical protein
LEPNGVEHSRRGLAKAGRRSASEGLTGEAFYDETPETVQIDKVGKLNAVAEGAAGGEDGVAETQ